MKLPVKYDPDKRYKPDDRFTFQIFPRDDRGHLILSTTDDMWVTVIDVDEDGHPTVVQREADGEVLRLRRMNAVIESKPQKLVKGY